MMSWIMLYYDALTDYSRLTDEQFGRLIRAGLLFAKTGEETELNDPEAYLWPGLRNRLLRDKDSYEEKCKKNTENINKRWEQQRESETEPEKEKPPDGYDRIRPNTNVYKSYEEKVKVKVESDKNDNYYYKSESEIKSEGNARRRLRADGYTDEEIDLAISRIPEGRQIKSLRAYLKKAIDEERREKREKIIGKHVPAQDYQQRDYSGEDERAMQRLLAFGQQKEKTKEEKINDYMEFLENEKRKAEGNSGGE